MANISKELQDQIVGKVIGSELSIAQGNTEQENRDFESYVDLLDSEREAKDYEWNSDIRLPEFVSHVLTQSSIDVNQYFQNKDFVETYLEDESKEALAKAAAAQECINRTLNQRSIYHYGKYVRARILNHVTGRVYAKCWWEQATKEQVVGTKEILKPLDFDINGAPFEGGDQIPAFNVEEVEDVQTVPIVDRFNYDVLDPRNVFTDNKYTYSLQQKDWIILRSEETIDDLRKSAKANGYFNLDKLKAEPTAGVTETARNSYNDGRLFAEYTKESDPVNEYWDVYERFGSFWANVTEVDEEGNPTAITPGIDESGEVRDDATLVETIITVAKRNGVEVLIRFQPTPFIDAKGEPFKPIIRGLCYYHPTNDAGMGDGKLIRELQLAIDDTFNLSNDRVMLATLPTLVTDASEDDNPNIYIEPGHNIPLEGGPESLKELGIEDNVTGALTQIEMLRGMMQQVDAIFPTTMGNVPSIASTTATAVAGAEQRTNFRSNYKALTFENTFLTEMYWMILQMTWRFAFPQTGEKLMGKKVVDFDAESEYTYKPLSQAVETEYSKANKVKSYNQILGYVVNMQHPDAAKLTNMLLQKIFVLMGDEFSNFSENLLNPETPIQSPGGSAEELGGGGASNQSGVEQSGMEQLTREGAIG